MEKTLLDQLREKVSDYLSRGVGYTSSKHSAARRFLASDIVQDVVVKFSQHPERADIRDIFAYFLGAIDREALRYATRWLRHREKQVELCDDLTPSQEPTVLDEVYRAEEKQEARQEVARLFNVATAAEREVLQLLRNGLSTSEIAEQLGIKDAAVRMRLHFLRKRFNRKGGMGKADKGAAQAPKPAPVLVKAASGLVSVAA